MEQIFCPQCGAEATSNDFACPRCESILNDAALESEPTSVVEALLTGNAPATVPAVRRKYAPPGQLSAAEVVAAETVPRLRRGVDLAMTPLPKFEAFLVAQVDGFLTLAEIAARAKLTAMEAIASFQGETLKEVVELQRLAVPTAFAEPPTIVDPSPLGGATPGAPVAPLPKALRITAPSSAELRGGAAVVSPIEDARPSRPAPKSSAPLADEESMFEASAALSAEGRIVGDRPAPPPSPPPGRRETRADLPTPAAGRPAVPGRERELELQPADDEPPLELARDVGRRAGGASGPRHRDGGKDATESVLELANALERRGDVIGAVQVLERAIATSQTPAPLYNRLALVMVRRGDLPRATSLLRKAAALDPRNPTYLRNLDKVASLAGGR